MGGQFSGEGLVVDVDVAVPLQVLAGLERAVCHSDRLRGIPPGRV